MPYNIPTSGNAISFFRDVNTMAGNNIPAISMLITIFGIAFLTSMGAGKRWEVAMAFASWVTTIVGFFAVVIFGLPAGLIIVPFLLSLVSLLLVHATS